MSKYKLSKEQIKKGITGPLFWADKSDAEIKAEGAAEYAASEKPARTAAPRMPVPGEDLPEQRKKAARRRGGRAKTILSDRLGI